VRVTLDLILTAHGPLRLEPNRSNDVRLILLVQQRGRFVGHILPGILLLIIEAIKLVLELRVVEIIIRLRIRILDTLGMTVFFVQMVAVVIIHVNRLLGHLIIIVILLLLSCGEQFLNLITILKDFVVISVDTWLVDHPLVENLGFKLLRTFLNCVVVVGLQVRQNLGLDPAIKYIFL